MNKSAFRINNGQVERVSDYVEYVGIIRQEASDNENALKPSGFEFDREAAAQYMDSEWRPNMEAYNYDTGEMEQVTLTDEQWLSYRNDVLDCLAK